MRVVPQQVQAISAASGGAATTGTLGNSGAGGFLVCPDFCFFEGELGLLEDSCSFSGISSEGCELELGKRGSWSGFSNRSFREAYLLLTRSRT